MGTKRGGLEYDSNNVILAIIEGTLNESCDIKQCWAWRPNLLFGPKLCIGSGWGINKYHPFLHTRQETSSRAAISGGGVDSRRGTRALWDIEIMIATRLGFTDHWQLFI